MIDLHAGRPRCGRGWHFAVGRSSGPDCAAYRCGGLPSLQKVSSNHVSLCCQVCEKYDDMIGRTLPVFCLSGCVPPPSREAQVNAFRPVHVSGGASASRSGTKQRQSTPSCRPEARRFTPVASPVKTRQLLRSSPTCHNNYNGGVLFAILPRNGRPSRTCTEPFRLD